LWTLLLLISGDGQGQLLVGRELALRAYKKGNNEHLYIAITFK